MNTKQYIEKFNLTSDTFSRTEFIEALGQELNERVELTKITREKQMIEFPFRIFRGIVKEMQDKFWAISSKTGKGLTRKLWNAFYATQVVPCRNKYFPIEGQELTEKHRQEKMMEGLTGEE